jgi:uncharacterized membrane protein YeaQ/YmgE (transglycosylase-associated protein family)
VYYDLRIWHLLWFVIMGAGFGWLGTLAFRGRGLGLRGNVAVGVMAAAVAGLAGDIHPLDLAILGFFVFLLWFVILGGLVGWLVGRAHLGFGCLGNVVLGVIGAVAGGLFLGFCVFVGPYIGGCPWDSLFTASFTAVLSLAIVIIFVRRR